jgi:hypothetical protein
LLSSLLEVEILHGHLDISKVSRVLLYLHDFFDGLLDIELRDYLPEFSRLELPYPKDVLDFEKEELGAIVLNNVGLK